MTPELRESLLDYLDSRIRTAKKLMEIQSPQQEFNKGEFSALTDVKVWLLSEGEVYTPLSLELRKRERGGF